MAERFEDRHRELREAAGGFPYADEAAAVAAEEAEDRLRDFYGRTGPLVDDLVAAAREVMRFYASAGVRFASGHSMGVMFDKLVSLDEASRG